MNDSEYRALKSKISRILFGELNEFIDRHGDDDKCLYELEQCIGSANSGDYTYDLEKAKIVLSVLRLKDPADTKEILSYLEHPNYGWQGRTYQNYRKCFQPNRSCRQYSNIVSSAEATRYAFADIDEIFLHEKYGAITTYLFGYSLAALFSSRLKNHQRAIPYFLQIACNRSSNVYRLVHEIVQICDVNTGLFEKYNKLCYKECDHDHITLYPPSTVDKAMDFLIYHRDIPIVIDGYEDEKNYKVLLCETSNIHGRTKRLDLKAKFNVLPIFLCPSIQSQQKISLVWISPI